MKSKGQQVQKGNTMETMGTICKAALRLRDAGMPLKKAVYLTASTYHVEPDAMFIYIAKYLEKGE